MQPVIYHMALVEGRESPLSFGRRWWGFDKSDGSICVCHATGALILFLVV